jgi:hypothetical protein
VKQSKNKRRMNKEEEEENSLASNSTSGKCPDSTSKKVTVVSF